MIKAFRVVLLCIALCGCGRADDVDGNSSKYSGREGEFFLDSGACQMAEAAAHGDCAKIGRLLQNGVSIDAPGRFGMTPLWWAMRNSNLNGFSCLLSHGASPNPRVDAITVAEMAAANKDGRFLDELIKYKANVDAIGPTTKTVPIQWAIEYGRTENLKRMISAGVNLNVYAGSAGFPLLTAVYAGRYDYVLMMLEAGADPGLSLAGGKITLANQISNGHLDPDGDAFIWRARVIKYLRKKRIAVMPPSNEGIRRKPLPEDLR